MEDESRRESRPKLYEREDVDSVIARFTPVDYSRKVKIGNLTLRFRDAGHILGSSFIEFEDGGARVAFSGDLGNSSDPILRPTAQLAEQDIVIMESTYGNRVHEKIKEREKELREVIVSTLKKKGVLIIPAFAIERTQLLLYELNHLVENRLIPAVDIFLDSPMAIKASEVFQAYPQYYNHEALMQVAKGDDLFTFPGLHKTPSREDSKMINEAPKPKVIIAGSGMMNAGRVLHHLVRYLGDANSTVLIVGYQAAGTLGRRLYSGEKRVHVLNERIDVKARVISIGAYSAHADQHQLVEWIRHAEHKPAHVYCTHGEEAASAALATRIREELGIPADVPRMDDILHL
jgi:metallo-beta-lactamase family protein